MRNVTQHLILLRHGHTVWHDTGGVAGVTDVALSPRGEVAAEALGVRLAEHFSQWNWLRNVQWYVSPMQRTRDTLQRVQVTIGRMECTEDARLKELSFGAWEGMTWQEVHQQHGDSLAFWGENWLHTAPPQGETFSAHIQRASAWLKEAMGNLNAEQQVVIAVCHNGTIKALLIDALGLDPKTVMNFSVNPATFTHLTCTDTHAGRVWALHALNH